ncbi:MAG: MinD/ParA family ATP-binding protein [Candidatus Kariarchaeaceae archaeon]|jgi:MinD-like ATPase involved in chromosome partitioning or flagellar assembly
MTLTVTVHSLRGGTGKTLISVNLAAFLVKLGYRVILIDLDLGAPSLQTYVKLENLPQARINDYFSDQAKLDQVLIDITRTVGSDVQGTLYMGLANDKGNIISKLAEREKEQSLEELYKLIKLVRDILPSDPWNADFIILDTSPGFSKDSLNAVAAADHLILALRLINADLGGTGEMLKILHKGLQPFTSLVLNQVPSAFVDDDSEEYTRELVKKHIIDPIGSNKIRIGGFIENDVNVIDREGEYAMYYLEGVQAQRPIHISTDPNGTLALNISKIATYVLNLHNEGGTV